MACKNSILETVREDDFVEYFLFYPIDTKNDKKQEVLLKTCLKQVNEVIENFTQGYLWHKDEFKLTLRTSISNALLQDNSRGNKVHSF